jgi:hypothetical protein
MAQNLVASGAPCVELPRRLAQEGARGLQLDLHVGQAELQRLELVDGLAEGLALAHVGQRGVSAACAAPSEQAAMFSRPPSSPAIAY